MAEKQYISAQKLLDDSFRLGSIVYDSGFRPTFIIALWRGAAPIGIAVQEFLAYRGVLTNHIAIRTSSYSGIDNQAREVAIYGMNYIVKNITHEDKLLIVDDVFDTGQTIQAVIDHLNRKARLNAPSEIRIAVPYYKPSRNISDFVPDYFLHETERWLKFPHSLEGLSDKEVERHRPRLYEILQSARRSVSTGNENE